MIVKAERRNGIGRLTLTHIALIAFALRLAWMLLVPIRPDSDSAVYDLLAQRIASGQGYTWPDGTPTSYWPVGTSALYAAVYALFGHNFAAAALLNVVLGVALVAAIYALARTRFDQPTSLLAALIAALWPSWIALTSILSSELPSNLLLVAGMAVIMSGRRYYATRIIAGTILLVGASFVRPISLPLIVAVPVLDALITRRWREAALGGAIAIVVAAALIAPWMIRNDRIFDKPVVISTNLGTNLWMGNNPASSGGYMDLPDDMPKNEAERDALLEQQALSYIAANPLHYLELCARRIVLSFDRESIAVVWNDRSLPDFTKTPLKIIMTGYWLGVFALSLVGAVIYIFKNPVRIFDPVIVAPALFAASAIFIVGMDRYHFGLMPFVSVFAASAVFSALHLISAQRQDGSGTTSSKAMPLDGP